ALAFGLEPAALDWQPGLALREPWRALTAAFVHYSALHLLANLAGTMLVGALGGFARVPASLALAWLVAWPLTQLGLLARPDLLHYGGLSGVLHAGTACVAVHLILHARGPRRAIGALLLIALATKVASEMPWGPPLRHPAGWDIATAPFAHASGLVAGVIAATLVEATTRLMVRHGKERLRRSPPLPLGGTEAKQGGSDHRQRRH
ncbi:MAG: rhombosortase, partial [Pseudomonadota bacterium]|nr:rhombosortase [Pseudomonadota bacterium]